MSQRRTLILVASVVVGILAALLIWNYVQGIEDEAFDNAELVPVYLVSEPISRSETGLQAEARIVRDNIPRQFKPANAITDPADISGLVAVTDLVPNQVVVSDMFVEASDVRARKSFSERLRRIRDQDQVALTISLDAVRGVNGLIQPGDYVNIMVTQIEQLDEEGNPVGLPEGANPGDYLFGQQARYLYQKAEVLAVDRSATAQTGETAEAAQANAGVAANAGMITLILPADAAQYIASIEPGRFYLALVAPDYVPAPIENIDPQAPIPGEDPTKLTPYGPDGADLED